MAAVPQKSAKEIQRIRAAQGSVHVLCVGISEQLKKSGYRALSKPKEDAKAVHAVFRETVELNAEAVHTKLLLNPSRGVLASAIDDLVANADEKDRILFFFSGHGERINDNFYLVPQDAWSAEDPTALCDFEDIKSKISASRAKQKIIMLDACYSGPDTTTVKKSGQEISKAFLLRALKDAVGAVTISSSSNAQTSTTKSPSADHSLFTHFLLKALKGEEDALDANGMLTTSTLHQYLYKHVTTYSKSLGNIQTPVIVEAIAGFNIVIGDFSKILSPSSHAFTSVSSAITFINIEEVRHSKLLPSRDEIDYSDFDSYGEIIETCLPKLYKDEIGKVRARIRKALGLEWEGIEIDRTSLYFENGGFSISYTEIDDTTGQVAREISFGKEWFRDPAAILAAVEACNLNPSKITLNLNKQINLLLFAKNLEQQGWEIDSFSEDSIDASQGLQYRAIIQSSQIDFIGFKPEEIVCLDSEEEPTRIASTVYGLLA